MVDKKYICTYFDYNFLPRGLALYYSVKRYHGEFDFFVLAFDKLTYEYLRNLNETHLHPVSVEEYDSYFKTSISKFADKKQYYFSATPNFCLYIIEKHPEIDVLLYLDADVFLFNSLDPLYSEFEDSSIGFCPHRVNAILRAIVKHYGKYNVGVNLFRNSETGLKCLRDWKEDCDSWYQGKPGYSLNFFSDQIFLDSWPQKYTGIKVITNIGIDVCYWNASNYTFTKKNNLYYVNDMPLVIFHFSSMKKVKENIWNTNSIYGFASIRNTLMDIFVEYINQIESFGLSNFKREKMTHKEKLAKRMFHSIMKIFINELVVIK
jgi:hypothetical protein